MKDEKVTVLVIDDDEDLLKILSAVIHEFGIYNVIATSDPESALNHIRTSQIGVVITDIMMPVMSGLELLEQIREIDQNVSVIMITGHADPDQMRRAIQLNAFDFIRKPFNATEIQIGIKQASEKNQLLSQNQMYQTNLEQLIQLRTNELFIARSKLEKSYLNTIYALINVMEAKDIYTKGHSERVTILSLLLAQKLGLSEAAQKILHLGALLHDIGKVGIYDSVLNKNETLTHAEYDVVKQHPIIGDRIIAPVGLPQAVHEIILQHHEWINGCGYPYGIKGDQISHFARIVSIADAFDAMTSQRCYRGDISRTMAFEEIMAGSHIQFDPEFARVFYEQRQEIMDAFCDENIVAKLLFGRVNGSPELESPGFGTRENI